MRRDRKRFRDLMKQGVPQLGVFIQSSDPVNVELAGLAGFDFVVVDLEHGGLYYNSIEGMCRAAEAADIDIIVRIPFITPNNVSRPLDSGATGIQAPQVNDAATARLVADNAKYAPVGCRGGARPRSSGWGLRSGYFREANDETVVVMHCETRECLENIDAILAVPGIDIVFAGPQDLSHSYGVPGDTANAVVQEAIMTMLHAARKNGVAPGIFVGSPQEAKKRIEQGFTYLLFATDLSLLLTMLKNTAAAVGLKH
jgi:4-hydroxy-2-oxoheptanedioate aldolase